MKIKIILILISAVMMLGCCCPGMCENTAEAVLVQDGDWSWSRGAYNTFSGQIDLSGCNADELTVCISADLPYNTETEQKSLPVFTSVNGKRIVMTKQSDTVRITRDADNPVISFSVSFRLPEKKRVSSVPFTFRVQDADGTELKAITGRIESVGEGTGNGSNPFYIPVDVSLITLILSAAAALVWAIVLIRHLLMKKKQRMGE